MANAKEMRGLSLEELNRRAGELRENVFNLRVKHRTGGVTNPAEIGQNRKELARVLTVLREKELAARAEGEKKA